MRDSKTLKHHAGLVDQMATTLGIDLEEATLRGDLEIDAIGEAVLRCTGCTNPQDCEQWLARHPNGAEAAPGYCRNADLLASLKPS